MSFARAFDPLLDLVFPPRCPLCGAGISTHGGLCAACWGDLAIPGEPSCRTCSRPFPADIPNGALCAPCLGDPPRHDGIAAATFYNDASRKLVLALKHGNRISHARLMARLIGAKLDFVDETWLIVPVPLHRWRIWRRGYNQAAELARELARITGGKLVVDLLERRKPTPSLGGLGKAARRRALSGAIAVRRGRKAAMKQARIILVDDVLTSGATSEACVSCLKRSGASKVVIACFARVLDEALELANQAE
ncbi:MAG: ComF family protein [Novosphingobium pentaromativorans]|uniref:ComF family protein n=1 Tax=Novosphingobium pentaromativorans TaxID=205844 RepID=A0A2W5Q947_9SPHN|nr:MAG: ComF family protein [Novosphingobium pentaromativorans]